MLSTGNRDVDETSQETRGNLKSQGKLDTMFKPGRLEYSLKLVRRFQDHVKVKEIMIEE